jgi:hypothetical protein
VARYIVNTGFDRASSPQIISWHDIAELEQGPPDFAAAQYLVRAIVIVAALAVLGLSRRVEPADLPSRPLRQRPVDLVGLQPV